jgi:hypothetical protein
MQCPRCTSRRIQRDFDDAFLVIRAVGLKKALCNNCGLVFKSFDPLGKLHRAPAKKTKEMLIERRRNPRYPVHLTASISLIERRAWYETAKYSHPSRGHCEAISKSGFALSLVGTRVPDNELSRLGRLLLIRVDLPVATIEAVTSIVNHRRIGATTKRKWILGVKIQQISDSDQAELKKYLEQKRHAEPLVHMG